MASAIVDQYGKPMARTAPVQLPAIRERVSFGDTRRNRISARFDAATTPDSMVDYYGGIDGMSARAAYSPGVRKVLREKMRYEVANNCYAKGMISTYCDYVIGTGPTLQVLTDDKEYNNAVETNFHYWAQAVSFYRKLWTLCFAFVQDGEGFGVFHTNYRIQNPVKLDLRLIECDQISDDFDFSIDWKREDGLILDDFGNVVGYKELPYHPGDTAWVDPMAKPRTLPARDVIHLFTAERPGTLRGVPKMAAALMLYPHLRRWTMAALRAAEHVAKLSGVIKSTYQVTDPVSPDEFEPIEIEENAFLTLPDGYDISQINPMQPAATYEMFKKEIVAEMARCLNMPYNVAAATNQNMNFASGKLDHTGWFKTVKIATSLFGDVAADAAFSRWHERAVLVDDMLPESPVDFDPRTGTPPHIWNWDGQEMIDPREADAQATALQNGITTIPELYSKRGKDWDEQLTNGAKALNISREEYQKLLVKNIFSNANKADEKAQAEKMAGDTPERENAQAA